MAKLYNIEGFEMTGGMVDTFYKLFWFGGQDDGDLPSKDGMSALVGLDLAVKDYSFSDRWKGLNPNMLTAKGRYLARMYYRKKIKKVPTEMLDTINRICGELPTRFLIKLHMEKGAAWVTLEDVVLENDTMIELDDSTLEEQILEALRVANENDD